MSKVGKFIQEHKTDIIIGVCALGAIVIGGATVVGCNRMKKDTSNYDFVVYDKDISKILSGADSYYGSDYAVMTGVHDEPIPVAELGNKLSELANIVGVPEDYEGFTHFIAIGKGMKKS